MDSRLNSLTAKFINKIEAPFIDKIGTWLIERIIYEWLSSLEAIFHSRVITLLPTLKLSTLIRCCKMHDGF